MTNEPAEQEHEWGLRAMMGALANRIGLAQRAGITFGGERDLFSALGYKKELKCEDYRARYDRGEVAGRVVDAKPRATWADGFEIVDDQDPTVETDLEEAWKEMTIRLDFVSRVQRADILAGLGNFAVLLIGAPGENLSEELPMNLNPEDIAFVSPFSELDVEVKSTVTSTDDPRFGLPESYQFNRIGSKTNRGRSRSAIVHWTRVIHLADDVLDDDINGQPRLRRVWNRLDDIDKVAGGGAEAFWMRANPPTVVSIDKDLKITSDDKKDLKTQMDELVNNMRRYVAGRGLEITQLSQSTADIDGPVKTLVSLVSAGSEIPQRILMGSERGELASITDRDNWSDVVDTRRRQYAEPQAVRPFVDRMIEHGALPRATKDEYEVRWPDIEALNDEQASKVAETWAKVNQTMGEVVVTRDEIRERVLRLPPIEDVTDGEADDLIEDNTTGDGGDLLAEDLVDTEGSDEDADAQAGRES